MDSLLIEKLFSIFYEGFCLDHIDFNAIWNSPHFFLSSCVTNTLVSIICMVYIGCVLMYNGISYIFSFSEPKVIKLDKMQIFLHGLCLILVIMESISEMKHDYNKSNFNSYFLMTCCLSVSIVLSLFCSFVVRQSRYLLYALNYFFWLLLLGGLTLRMYLKYNDKSLKDGKPEVISYLFYISVILELAYLSLDVSTNSKKEPENSASLYGRFAFSWLNETINHIVTEDAAECEDFHLSDSEKALNNYNRFKEYWTAECNKRVDRDRKQIPTSPQEVPDESLIGVNNSPSLLIAILRTYVYDIATTWTFGFIYDFITFVNPFLLLYILRFIKDLNEPIWHGYFYCCIFTCIGLITAISNTQYGYLTTKLSLKIKAAIVSAIYRKSLKINVLGHAGSIGELVNLVMLDSESLGEVLPFVWIVLSTSLQIIITIYLLYCELGFSICWTTLVLSSLYLSNNIIVRGQHEYEEAEMEIKDSRITCIDEIVSYMKTIKLYAWETFFRQKAEDLRNRELVNTKIISRYNTCSMVMWHFAPFLLQFIAFLGYIYTNIGQMLTPEKAFVCMSLFNMIKFPLMIFPLGFSTTANATVALRRIQRFLLSNEISEHRKLDINDEQENYSIEVRNAIINYSTFGTPIVNRVTGLFPRGKLSAIIGESGSGKTTFILGLLNEINLKADNQILIRGKISYTPQVPWIENLSVKDNILFGEEMNEERYNTVLRITCLLPDLERLSHGDETFVGEKGSNLSGGQKQRLSLARAIYQKADIYIFDDALSALDATLHRQIFNEVIGPRGLLKGTTRILVTHSMRLLPDVDRIFILNKVGKFSDEGTYQELFERTQGFTRFPHANQKKKNNSKAGSQANNSSVDSSYDVQFVSRTTINLCTSDSNNSNNPNNSSPRESRDLGSDNLNIYTRNNNQLQEISNQTSFGEHSPAELNDSNNKSRYDRVLVSRMVTNLCENNHNFRNPNRLQVIKLDPLHLVNDSRTSTSSTHRRSRNSGGNISPIAKRLRNQAARCSGRFKSGSKTNSKSSKFRKVIRKTTAVDTPEIVPSEPLDPEIPSSSSRDSERRLMTIEEFYKSQRKEVGCVSDNIFSDAIHIKELLVEDNNSAKKRINERTRQIRRRMNVQCATKGFVAISQIGKDEKAAGGRVSARTYKRYIEARGITNSVLMLFGLICYCISQTFGSKWLQWFTEDPMLSQQNILHLSREEQSNIWAAISSYMIGYGVLGLCELLSFTFYAYYLATSNITSSRILHSNLLESILRAKMKFYHDTPAGRIVNRFSKDIEIVDHSLVFALNGLIFSAGVVVSCLLVICYATPMFIWILFPVGIIYFYIQNNYIPVSRHARRYDSITRSPIFSHFQSTLNGLPVIRTFQQQARFEADADKLLDLNAKYYYLKCSSNHWLTFRLDIIGTFVVVSATFLAVWGRNILSAGIVGLSLTYALQVTENLNWLVQKYAEVETNAVALERIFEYSDVEREACRALVCGDEDISNSWPENGVIQFKDFSASYQEDLEPVLKNINVVFNAGEKIGIVGRSGSGKSTLMLALTRILEAKKGMIIVDEKRLHEIGLDQIRSRFCVFPQEPTVFTGTLRENLDPLKEKSTSELWKALEKANLLGWARRLRNGLEHQLDKDMQLSLGQKQLLCLARALLKKSKVVLLDEITAAVDASTGDMIMHRVKKGFLNSTILIIAHKLNTLKDVDKILFLQNGEIIEYDSPAVLMNNKNSAYAQLLQNAS